MVGDHPQRKELDGKEDCSLLFSPPPLLQPGPLLLLSLLSPFPSASLVLLVLLDR